MSLIFTLRATAARGSWYVLLHLLEVEAWFWRAPTVARAERLGGGLPILAALRQHIPETTAVACTLYVAFDLQDHRYPATLFHAASVAQLPFTAQPSAYLASKGPSLNQSLGI